MLVDKAKPYNNYPIYPALALLLILAGISLLLFTGIRTSNDEIYLFDTTESLVRHGHFELTYTFHLQPNISLDGTPSDTILYEPLQSILSAPLFLLGQNTPQFGIMHTVFTFNIIVTIITAILLYGVGCYWGYSWQISLLVALLYGLTTSVLPYSVAYFREPLAGLFSFIAFIASLELRKRYAKRRLALIPLLILIVALIASGLTKLSNLSILPAIFLILSPSPQQLKLWVRQPIRLLFSIGILVTVVFFTVLLLSSDGIPQRFTINSLNILISNIEWRYVFESIAGYQLSPGRSIWLYSPILIAGMWGFYLNRHNGGLRMILVIFVTLITMSATFGAVHRQIWWSGTGWGTRYLLPMIPIIMLGMFPVIARLQTHKRYIEWICVGSLAILGFVVQILGIAIFVGDYTDTLTNNAIEMGSTGMWSIQWSQIPQYIALLLDGTPLNFALFQDNVRLFWGVFLYLIMLVVSGIALIWWLNREKPRLPPMIISVLITGIAVSVGVIALLYSIYDDPRYTRDDNLIELIDQLNTQVTEDDVVFVQDSEMSLAFMNRFRVDTDIYVLPFAPGEVHNPDVPPPATSDSLVDLASYPTISLIDYEAQSYETLWLVMPYGPFNTFTRRPTERYMVENYFPVNEITVSQNARAIQFHSDLVDGHMPQSIEEEYTFGDQLRLIETSLSDGTTFLSGDTVPVTFTWQPVDTIDRDYSISVQIGDLETQVPIVQRDTTPQGQFGYTSLWQIDETYVDNHALTIPENTLTGEYCLNVIVYYWEDGARLPITDESANLLGDVLCIVQISVE